MNLSDKDRKTLWTKAANVCSFRYNGKICQQKLVVDSGDTIATLGIEAHIIGGKNHSASARGINTLPLKERDTYENAILLCGVHHLLVDADEIAFPIEILKKMKKEHEDFVESSMSNTQQKELIIKDFDMNFRARDVEEAMAMEVNVPAKLNNVKLDVSGENVNRLIGFSTNQTIRFVDDLCKECKTPFRSISLGNHIFTCEKCGYKTDLN